MPASKKKRRPATRSGLKSLVETEAVESGLALNFFYKRFELEIRKTVLNT